MQSTLRYRAAFIALLIPSVAHAGGFYVPEIGPRAVGMAGAVTAQAADASALVHNPAGMAGQSGLQSQIGAALVLPSFTFFRRPLEDPSTRELKSFPAASNTNSLGAVPYLSVIGGLLDDRLSVGLGVYAPFGAALEFPEDGAQRHVVTRVDLRTIHVSPAVAYRFSDAFSIGLAVSYVFADFHMEQVNALQFVTGDPEQFPDPSPEVEGKNVIQAKDTFSIGGRLGLLYQGERFSLGLSVLAPVTLHLEGNATVTNPQITELLGDADEVLMGAGQRSDNVKLEMPMPLIIHFGAMVAPHERLRLAVDISWQGWSRFERLTVDFENDLELLPTPGAKLVDVVVENKWRDTLSVRLGGEWTPWGMDVVPLWLRGGAFFDQSPIDDRHFDLLTPDSDKIGVSAGIGYRIQLTDSASVDVDAVLMHIQLAERNIGPSTTNLAGMDAPIPGSDRTIVNKSAPSFYYGVTRSRVELAYLSLSLRL